MKKYLETLTKLLEENNVEYSIHEPYVEILNTCPATRIKLVQNMPPFEDIYSMAIQEFDECGKEIYYKEFAEYTAKPFMKRVLKNIG